MKKAILPIGAMFLAALAFSACDLRPRQSSITLSAEPFRVGQPITITPLDRDGNTVDYFGATISRIMDDGSGFMREYASGRVDDSKLVYYPPIDGTYQINIELPVREDRLPSTKVTVPKGSSPAYAALVDLNGKWVYKYENKDGVVETLELYFAALSETSPRAEDWSLGVFVKDSSGTAISVGYIVYDAASTYCRLYLRWDATSYYRTDFTITVNSTKEAYFSWIDSRYCTLPEGAKQPSDSDSYTTLRKMWNSCRRSETLYLRMLNTMSAERSTIKAALVDR